MTTNEETGTIPPCGICGEHACTGNECSPRHDEPDDWDDDDQDEGWCDTCQNMGIIDCHCGGDLCVCMNHGEMPCPDCDRGW